MHVVNFVVASFSSSW